VAVREIVVDVGKPLLIGDGKRLADKARAFDDDNMRSRLVKALHGHGFIVSWRHRASVSGP
jgi:hypothetical protein